MLLGVLHMDMKRRVKQAAKLLGIKGKLKKAQSKAINDGLNGHNLLVIAPPLSANPLSFKSWPCSRVDYPSLLSPRCLCYMTRLSSCSSWVFKQKFSPPTVIHCVKRTSAR